MDFSHLRNNKAQKTPLSQKGMNLLPLWAYARTAEFSNLQSFYGDLATELGDMSGEIRQSTDNNTCTLNNLWYQGEVYSHVVDPAFVFQFQELRDAVEYTAPVIKGVKGITTYDLSEVKDSSQSYLIKSVPSTATEPTLTYTVADKVAPTTYSFLGNAGDGTEVRVPEDNYVFITVSNSTFDIGELFNGKHYIPIVTLRNKRYPEQFYSFKPYRNGEVTRSRYPLSAGTYIVETGILKDDSSITLDTWGFGDKLPELSYSHYGINSASQFIWGLDEDPSYLNVLTPPPGGRAQGLGPDADAHVVKTFVLLGEDQLSHEARSLAKPDYMPIMFVLSEEEDNLIHVYDTYYDQATEVHVDNEQPLLDLEVEVIDWRIGDEIVASTKRSADFMDSEITGVRLRVEEKYTGTVKYIDTSGNVISAGLAAINTPSRVSRFKDMRWRFQVTDPGTHTFYLEVKVKGQSFVDTASYIIHVGYKEPIKTLNVPMPLGRTLQSIGVWIDGQLYGEDELGNVYQMNLLYDSFYIDYEENIVYTLSDYDHLELTY